MSTRAQSRRSDRQWAGWIVIAILAVVVGGFSRSFFLRPFFDATPAWAASESIFYMHGALFSSWYGLLGVQTLLIRSGARQAHRQFGYGASALAIGILIVGTYSSLLAANRPGGFKGVPFPPDHFLIVPLIGMLLFAIFHGLAIAERNNAPAHKRWVLLAAISLLGAPVARIVSMVPALPFFSDAIVYASLVAAMMLWDWDTRGRLRRETLWGGSALVAANVAAIPLGAMVAWRGFAQSLMSLTGPPW
jgi:uncharacterized membrane protein YozB (DUF420 family)